MVQCVCMVRKKMAEEITNAKKWQKEKKLECNKKEVFDVSFKLKVLSRPFLINIAFTLEFYLPSFSIRCFPAPETYCIRGKHSRKYGNRIHSLVHFLLCHRYSYINMYLKGVKSRFPYTY